MEVVEELGSVTALSGVTEDRICEEVVVEGRSPPLSKGVSTVGVPAVVERSGCCGRAVGALAEVVKVFDVGAGPDVEVNVLPDVVDSVGPDVVVVVGEPVRSVPGSGAAPIHVS